ncbi:MAG: NADH-quinone oxidoreductase subunit E, partial [Alistipes sp.]|nr:NADH-quinone oxidoreductase subunit E [Alistipes sp.]
MLFYVLLAAIVAIVAIFLTPERKKVWTATAITSLLAVGAIALAVYAFLVGEVKLFSFRTAIFGYEYFAVDRLSALFLVIIAIASVATVIYSRGYLAGYFGRYSSAHFSLHYTALVALVASMMCVVLASGGFSFLFSWEL